MVRHILKLSSTALRSIIMQESNGGPHDVYNTTTTTEPSEATEEPPEPKVPLISFEVPNDILSRRRCLIKVVEVFLSFLSFVLEEIVTTCESCMPLYFFEFFSCSAFMFTLLLLVLLATNLHTRVKMTINVWAKVDFGYTLGMAVMFLCSSMAFAIKNEGTLIEHAAAAFGIMSSMVFFLDFVVLVRTADHPWRKWDPKMPQDDGEDGGEPDTEPESQRLNPLPNGTGGE